MVRVYIVGQFSGNNQGGGKGVIQVLENIRIGIRAGTELLLAGFAPFCAWLDHQYFFQLRDNEHIDEGHIKAYSIEWLGQCQAVLLLNGWWYSPGAQIEVSKAKEWGIPTFNSIEEIIEWRESINEGQEPVG